MANLAFIGLGIMGLPMSGHLLSAGHRLTVSGYVDTSHGRVRTTVDRTLATSLGLSDDALGRLMTEVGFRASGEAWKWRGHRARHEAPSSPRPGNAFAALAGLKG